MSKNMLKIKNVDLKYRKGVIVKYSILFVVVALITATFASFSYSENINKGLSDSLIRLHVVANSDSEPDQQLKRDVRDRIIELMKLQLDGSESLEQSKAIINSKMSEIIQVAEDEIGRQGKNYPVKAALGSYPFPTKVYGDITLPAGNYQALKIEIGKGEGANWWCVLFPPLCFIDATHGTIPDSVKADLKDVLSAEEYSIITSADEDDDIPIKVKFKLVEFFNESRVKFVGFFSKLFGISQ